MTVAYVDIETTGLVPAAHSVWEVALIVDGVEHAWLVNDPKLGTADAKALQVGGFYDRWATTPSDRRFPGFEVADQVARHTAGRHLVGLNPTFDAAFLDRMLRQHNRAPAWHYHLIDVGAMAYGWLHGNKAVYEHWESVDPGVPDFERRLPLDLPWRSDELARACGIDPDRFDRHTALGDARFVKAWFELLAGQAPR